jgi:dihydrodipicolinate synthase/N-acetylneuraminate lyase
MMTDGPRSNRPPQAAFASVFRNFSAWELTMTSLKRRTLLAAGATLPIALYGRKPWAAVVPKLGGVKPAGELPEIHFSLADGTNRRLAGLLAELGYKVAFVRPGRDLSPQAKTDEVVANMRQAVQAIAEAGLAVGLYSIPDVSGLPLTPDAAALLIAGPGGERIVAIKVTEANYEPSTLRFLEEERLGYLKIVQGWDTHLARALRDGPRFDAGGRQRCGVTSGPMSFAVFQYLHILAAAERGDWEEVTAAQAAVTRLFEAMQDDPTKFADLQRAKYIMGLGQPLTGAVTKEQFERVLTALESLPRAADRERLARSLNLMEDGPFAERLRGFYKN